MKCEILSLSNIKTCDGGIQGRHREKRGGIPCEHGVLWGNECKVNMGCDGLIQGRHSE